MSTKGTEQREKKEETDKRTNYGIHSALLPKRRKKVKRDIGEKKEKKKRKESGVVVVVVIRIGWRAVNSKILFP